MPLRPSAPLLLSSVVALGSLAGAGPARAAEPLPPVELSATVPAPPEKVWEAFTTSEGVKRWMVSQAELDTRNGGLWKTKYGKEGTLGDEGTIFNEVLAVDPGRMYVLRIQKPPKGFPFMSVYKDMWTVVYFDPAEDGKTRVRLRAHGFTDVEESRKMRSFFQAGNQATLDALVSYFKKQAAAPTVPFTGTAREVLTDGTLVVQGVDRMPVRVRLWGVTLPESGTPAFRTARTRLVELTVGMEVRVLPHARAENGDLVATVRCSQDAFLYQHVDSGNVNHILLRDGMLSRDASRDAEDPHLSRHEGNARAAGRGIWRKATP